MKTEVKAWQDTRMVDVLIEAGSETELAVLIALASAKRVSPSLEGGKLCLTFRFEIAEEG